MLRCSGQQQQQRELEDFPLEPIPAPPAQFNTGIGVGGGNGVVAGDDELALAGENVALIRSPALKGNGHAVQAMLR